MRYSKPPLSVSDQAQRLIERGMTVSDLPRTERYLKHIGYYRLSAYWLPFEFPADPGASRTHRFSSDVSFDRIVGLYVFDRKLRLLVLEAMERIEVSVRTQWASELSVRTDTAHPHLDPSMFKDFRTHVKDLHRLVQEVERSGEVFVKHYSDHYSEPGLPPIWACVETMSLGALSQWIKNTRHTETKKALMRSLGLPTVEILEKVLHTLTPVRNVCAHHARLWNRRFALSYPDIKKLAPRMVAPITTLEQHLLFNHLVILDHLMVAIQPGTSWTRRLLALLEEREPQELAWMGFPSDWRLREPWVALSSVTNPPSAGIP